MEQSTTIYSPYEKIYNYWGEDTLSDVPSKIRDYLLLMPCKECPNPITTNDNPRARLVKYLFYDEPNPLEKEMPSVQDRLNIIFDPYAPDKPPLTEKGFRFFTQSSVSQANIIGQTIIRVVMGQMVAPDPYKVNYSVNFQILSNYSLEANTRTTALLRTYNMELAIIQALHGVNIDGVGAFMLARSSHISNGSKPITDDQELVGRLLTMSFENAVSFSGDTNPTSRF